MGGKDAFRYSCYSAAEGSTQIAKITNSRFLIDVYGPNYFKEILNIPATKEELFIFGQNMFFPKMPSPKRIYKLAYYIMFHDPNSLENLKNLIDIVDDGELAVILIHIDEKAAEHTDALKQYILSRHAKLSPSSDLSRDSDIHNIFLFNKNHKIIYGHVSMVFTQLDGFWALEQLAEWEYVINLSCYDYPLVRNDVIYRTLSQKEYKGKSIISSWFETTGNFFQYFYPDYFFF